MLYEERCENSKRDHLVTSSDTAKLLTWEEKKGTVTEISATTSSPPAVAHRFALRAGNLPYIVVIHYTSFCSIVLLSTVPNYGNSTTDQIQTRHRRVPVP